jgi:hypothetical protein
MAQTAQAMSPTPQDVFRTPPADTELLETLTWSQRGERYQLEIKGNRGGGAVGVLTRSELQRIMQMLQEVVGKCGWTTAADAPQDVTAPVSVPASPIRH